MDINYYYFFLTKLILIINGCFREYLINPLQYGFIMLRLEDHNLLLLRFFSRFVLIYIQNYCKKLYYMYYSRAGHIYDLENREL